MSACGRGGRPFSAPNPRPDSAVARRGVRGDSSPPNAACISKTLKFKHILVFILVPDVYLGAWETCRAPRTAAELAYPERVRAALAVFTRQLTLAKLGLGRNVNVYLSHLTLNTSKTHHHIFLSVSCLI